MIAITHQLITKTGTNKTSKTGYLTEVNFERQGLNMIQQAHSKINCYFRITKILQPGKKQATIRKDLNVKAENERYLYPSIQSNVFVS